MRADPHSYADDRHAQTRSIELSLRVDFAARVLEGEVLLRFRAPAAAGPLDLDTRDLRIDSVSGDDGAPLDLRALMAAAPAGPDRFAMPQPIPSYLLAFCVGDLAKRDLSPRCAVWAEPPLVEAAAWEFAGMEKMLAAAERLFGPYEWERC